MLICEDTSLSNFYGVGVLTLALLPFFDPGKRCIVEKSQSPSLRVFVVLLKDVQALAFNVLPFSNGFLDQFNVFKEFPQDA
jgi:hypothetical protein